MKNLQPTLYFWMCSDIGKQMRMSILTTSIQQCTAHFSQCTNARKIEGIRLERNIFITDDIIVYIENPKESYKKKKQLKLMSI